MLCKCQGYSYTLTYNHIHCFVHRVKYYLTLFTKQHSICYSTEVFAVFVQINKLLTFKKFHVNFYNCVLLLEVI